MTESRIDIQTFDCVAAEEQLQAREDGVAGPLQLARPLHVARDDDDVAVAELDGGYPGERRTDRDRPGECRARRRRGLAADDLREHGRRETLEGLHDPSIIASAIRPRVPPAAPRRPAATGRRRCLRLPPRLPKSGRRSPRRTRRRWT